MNLPVVYITPDKNESKFWKGKNYMRQSMMLKYSSSWIYKQPHGKFYPGNYNKS